MYLLYTKVPRLRGFTVITVLQELQKFCRHVVAGFFHMADTNPLVFVELLLWKTSQEVYELTEGYGALERERCVE